MEKVIIEKLDNQGRGICFINNKITFIPNTLPTEEVEVEIVKESKKFNEAKVINYIKQSPIRIPSICPYFENCGGCDLLHSSYKDTIKYKKEKLESILYKYAHLKKDIEIVECDNHLNYRNKITLKVQDGKYGYYIMDTHDLIEIDNCYLAEEPINDFIKDLKHLNMRNGQVIIRCNYNQELLIWLKSKEKVNPDIEYLKSKHKIVGIVLNEKVLVGEPSFIEIINHMLFTISYDSFFQVNRNICSKLFNLIEDEIDEDEVILDLYCGVGTLGINATKKAKKAYGIEIVKNAVLNAITNSKINKRDNIYYMLGDVGETLPKIKDEIDTIIVDPPRAGLDPKTKETLLEFKANKLIYVSCDPMTLARDLKDLQEIYNIKTIKGLDMFPFTQHCESITVLERR
jgi:23S rRNA (uracil1939-C5)-methyltransferase